MGGGDGVEVYENRGGRDWCGGGVVVMLRQCWWYRNFRIIIHYLASNCCGREDI